jgi:hypothetical protein
MEPSQPPVEWLPGLLTECFGRRWKLITDLWRLFSRIVEPTEGKLNRYRTHRPSYFAFVARIACDEHDVSCVVLFHLRNCSTDFGEVLYWGSAIRSGRIYFWLESVQATPVLYGVGIYLYTLPQTDLQETVVDLSDVKWAIIPIKVHNLRFSTNNGPGVGGGGGYGVVQLVEAVRHKSEGREFDSH